MPLAFLVGGTVILSVAAAGLTLNAMQGESPNGVALIAGAMAVFFLALGIGLHYHNGAKIIFSKKDAFFWNSHHPPGQIPGYIDHGTSGRLEDIHALQILRKFCFAQNNSFTSYELNLVLHDASRFQLLDHHDIHHLRMDGKRLAEWLQVPIWDMTLDPENSPPGMG